MSLHEFHKPGKGYKQVKADTQQLPDQAGADKQHRVMVYMSTAGTPHFAIGVPYEYCNAWKHHRAAASVIGHGADRIDVTGGVVTAASFDEVIRKIQIIGYNFQHHIRNLTMRKVIRLALEIKGASDNRSHNAPSFSYARVLVGIRSGVYWEVNGGYYASASHRKFFLQEDPADEDPGEPSYADLSPSGMDGKPVTIPFTPEAWATVQRVESMLQRAGDMLLGLTNPETAVPLLQGGFNVLLAAPEPTK